MSTAKPDTDKISVPFPDDPGSVYMTPEQWGLFKERHGEALAYHLCERAEWYAEQSPRKWAKYKDHFRTLENWHRMKLSDGYVWFLHPVHGYGYYKQWIVDRFSNGAA